MRGMSKMFNVSQRIKKNVYFIIPPEISMICGNLVGFFPHP